MNEMNELLSKILLLLSTFVALYKLYFDYTTKNIKELIKLDVESCNFLTTDLKEFYKEEQRRAMFKKYSGMDVSSRQQILIKELSLKLNDKFSWYKLKIASAYFKYNEDSISIYIKRRYILGATLSMIMSTLLVISSLLLIWSNIFDHIATIPSIISSFTICIISILYAAYFACNFVAPVNVAQSIDKQLKIKEMQPCT